MIIKENFKFSNEHELYFISQTEKSIFYLWLVTHEICNFHIKDIEILAIILVPLIMTLSRGHTGQIKRTVVMR